MRLIFKLYRSGLSTKQIAYKLNADGVPVLGDKLRERRMYSDWRACNVGALLRNELVLGLVQPHHMVNGERVAVGAKVKLYPAAITADDWLAVQEMLGSRTQLRGRKGTVPNLFTSKVFCGRCTAAMRVTTGGGEPRQKFQCSAYLEGRSCHDATRYPVPAWERLILTQIIERSQLAPRTKGDQNHAADALAEARLEMDQLTEQIAFIEPRIARSATMAERWERLCEQLDALRATADNLALEAAATQSSSTRHEEVFVFMHKLVGPALRGDRDSREQLRGLLSRVDFKVTFGGMIKGIDLTVGDWSDSYPAL